MSMLPEDPNPHRAIVDLDARCDDALDRLAELDARIERALAEWSQAVLASRKAETLERLARRIAA
jgi:hypothetical protein